ncbi:MAG: aminotransferase class V-fold PLP-dependent enzyme, partial [Bryobacteraceae bacterium]
GSSTAPRLPPAKLLDRDREKYWLRVREEQFYLPGWRAFLNNGSLGIAPKAVIGAVEQYLEQAAGLAMDDYPRWGYETLDAHRAEMAAFLGCHADELAFTHNATEAMSVIAGGLELKPGDEVLLTDQEHPSGRMCWLMKERRSGIAVRQVAIPLPPRDPGQLTDVLISAIGPRTRVLSFSGITSPTGLIFPVKEICAAARARGVLTVVDGAHMNGQISMRIGDLGCDYYAGSPHKWLFAPAGCGILWMRQEHIDRHWPAVVSSRWDDRSIRAARFMQVGTNNRAIFEGMLAGVRFAAALGPQRIYSRIHELAKMVRERAAQIPYLDLLTPDDDRMYGALVTFRFRDRDPRPLFEACKRQRIWTTGSPRLRLSTHIHTRPSDVDLFFRTMRKTLG